MPPADPAAAAAEVAGALLGGPVDRIAPVRGAGRNSRIYRVSRAGEDYALKHYPEPERDGRRRLGVELGALDLMTGNGIACVPRAVAADRERGYALLEWIDGDPVADPRPADIDAAAEFLAAVHELRRLAAAQNQPLAAEACLSGGEIRRQIEARLARLSAIEGEPELAAFLEECIAPLVAEISAWAEAGYRGRGMDFNAAVPPAARSLCPSDFGFHNALRAADGRLAFLDFDYFGWDDPVKLTADFLLHPGMRLSETAKSRFASTIGCVYRSDPGFSLRLPLLFPLFALRWCLILLNEFLPERWAHRRHAGVEAEWAEAKRRQLDRSADWVQSLATNFRRFPYGE